MSVGTKSQSPQMPPIKFSSSSNDPEPQKKRLRSEKNIADFHEEQNVLGSLDLRLIWRVWPFLKPHKTFLFSSILILLVLSFLNLWRPIVMGKLVDEAGTGDSAGLMRNGLILSALVVFTQLLGFIQTYWMQIAGARTMADLRSHVFAFLQKLELRYFDKTPIGRLTTRATSDVDAVGEMFASGVLNALGDLVQLMGIVTMMLRLNYKLAIITFACLPIVFFIVNFVRKRSRLAFRDIRTKTARLNAFLGEQVSGMAVVQAYAREHQVEREFDVINNAYRDANRRSVFYEAILDAAIEMVLSICVASIIFWAGREHFLALAKGGKSGFGAEIGFSTVVIFTQYVKQFFEPVSLLAQRYTLLQSAMSGAERIFQLLDEPAFESETDGLFLPVTVSKSEEAFVFDHVHFSYKPGAPVLQDISLRIKRGEKVALVGATGAGKSTIASLLLRLYDATSGTVSVDGRDVKAWKRSELRSKFAVVPQEVFLFSGTVLSNIAMNQSVSRERAERCLRRVGATSLLLNRGLDAVVDERGANFSAGERQLIAFARALYRDAPFLILDEATANIDSDTESKLQSAVDEVLIGRSAVVIAHRLATIRKLDRIVVFHKGLIHEMGTHDELIQRGGLYSKLHALQFSGRLSA